MLNLGVLDTAIAVVVILLLLSLIVQSIQTFLKKLTRFKSQQIARSLEKLFAQVPQPAPATPAPGAKAAAPPTPKEMKDAVLGYFENLGRDSLFGHHALESLSKADLSKIVAAVQATHLLPQDTMTAIQSFYTEYQKIDAAVAAVANASLSADAQEKLTQLRAQVAPIQAQVAQLFKGGKLDPKAAAADIFALRNLDTTAIVTAASELQKSIETSAAADPANTVLQKTAADAATLAKIIANVNTYIVSARAQLQARFGSLESWFDTVMQGFQERYARHMRTWSFVIGLGVAIAMNANVVQIFTRFSGDDIERQRVIARGAAIQEQYTKQIGTAPAAGDNNIIDEMKAKLATNAETYSALGLTPMSLVEWKAFVGSAWSADFWKTIVGWLIMAFLLSLGAPFWHDTLESLFGVKNLLRQRTGSQNVEQGSGEGMTQSS